MPCKENERALTESAERWRTASRGVLMAVFVKRSSLISSFDARPKNFHLGIQMFCASLDRTVSLILLGDRKIRLIA